MSQLSFAKEKQVIVFNGIECHNCKSARINNNSVHKSINIVYNTSSKYYIDLIGMRYTKTGYCLFVRCLEVGKRWGSDKFDYQCIKGKEIQILLTNLFAEYMLLTENKPKIEEDGLVVKFHELTRYIFTLFMNVILDAVGLNNKHIKDIKDEFFDAVENLKYDESIQHIQNELAPAG